MRGQPLQSSLFKLFFLALNFVAVYAVFAGLPNLLAQSATANKPAEKTAVAEPTIHADVVYGHKMGMALTLDVIQPSEQNGAAVVFIVSGGWNSNWFPAETYRRIDLLNQLVDRGYAVILLRHGSAPLFKVPDAVADVKRAIKFLNERCDDYGFEEHRIGACGMSAGGHLSLMLGTDTNQSNANSPDESDKSKTNGEVKEKTDIGATQKNDQQTNPTDSQTESDNEHINPTATVNSSLVAAVVAYFPPTDLRDMIGPSANFPALDFDSKKGDAVSPIVHVTPDDAPTLLVHGTADRLVPIRHSEQIKSKFSDDNVPCELITIDGAGHGFQGEAARKATQSSLDWFERFLNPPTTE